VALVLAGCGAAPGPTVATAQHPGQPSTSASGVPESGGASDNGGKGNGGDNAGKGGADDSDYDKALRYTRCLTAHGVVTPDPVVGQPLVTFNILRVGDPPGLYAAKRDAHEKCKQFLPATWPLKTDPGDNARSGPFFDCMRQHGQPEPSPGADGMVHERTDGSWRSTPEYKAALQACRHLYDDPANNQ